MATSFSGDSIVYFGTGGPGDPSPIGGSGSCGRNPANPNYFAAITPTLYHSRDLCGQCAQITCSSCSGRTVTVEIIDMCPSCDASADNGSLAISLQAMGDLLGGVDVAKNAGKIRNASWQLISCPSSLGANQSPVSGGGVSTATPSNTNGATIPTTTSTAGGSTGNAVSPTSPPTVVTVITVIAGNGTGNNNGNTGTSSDSNFGPILGGSAAAVFLLLVVAFVLWLKVRTARQQREEAQIQIINRFGGSGGGSSGHPTLRRNASVPDMALRPASGGASDRALVVPGEFLPAIPTSAPLSMDRPPQPYYKPNSPPIQQYGVSSQPLSPQPLSPQPQYYGQPVAGAPQQPLQQQADYSKEWAEYFKEHPEEYEKYYGTPMPR
ncbi:UNVERIFIED_CONTAM: hypothetical protein HDU68_008855 [Siphonaria sp. JEL0065]|nr:hypothetical protein HDU68_008855 [Siphonaria sp. JEL0065]